MLYLWGACSLNSWSAEIQRILQLLDCVEVLSRNNIGRDHTRDVPEGIEIKLLVWIFEQRDVLEISTQGRVRNHIIHNCWEMV